MRSAYASTKGLLGCCPLCSPSTILFLVQSKVAATWALARSARFTMSTGWSLFTNLRSESSRILTTTSLDIPIVVLLDAACSIVVRITVTSCWTCSSYPLSSINAAVHSPCEIAKCLICCANALRKSSLRWSLDLLRIICSMRSATSDSRSIFVIRFLKSSRIRFIACRNCCSHWCCSFCYAHGTFCISGAWKTMDVVLTCGMFNILARMHPQPLSFSILY